MLKILVVVLMVGATESGGRDLYVFTEPTFTNVDDCKTWAMVNPEAIIMETAEHYGNRLIENVFCVPEQSLQEQLQNGQPKAIKGLQI
tara:strand:- start:116 stop:379 length:264 start_codon:yes stop_codon:yes gene_type:complete